jgi:hypothetical protein
MDIATTDRTDTPGFSQKLPDKTTIKPYSAELFASGQIAGGLP